MKHEQTSVSHGDRIAAHKCKEKWKYTLKHCQIKSRCTYFGYSGYSTIKNQNKVLLYY